MKRRRPICSIPVDALAICNLPDCLLRLRLLPATVVNCHLNNLTLLAFLFVLLNCLIGSIWTMASNPYVSGIKLSGNRIEDQSFYGEVKSVVGGHAELPCNLTLPSPDDAIQLIFWYRGNNSRVPIYSVDSRTSLSSLSNATHFPSDIFSPKRATFDLTARPSALLIIDPVLEDDHGEYRCRVDFRWGRTISSFVSLHVVVPPKRIAIRDQNGNYFQNSTIGPYNQNSDVILTCESNGGIPPPILHWYKNNVMVDGSYVYGENGIVSNDLTIYNLSGSDLHDKFVCQAGNFNSSSPIEVFVIIDINLLPVDVRIVSPRTPLMSGRKIEVRCEAYGSRPNAVIKWFKNNKQITHTTETYEPNKTVSAITLMPTMYDNDIKLHCRASNPKLPDKYVQDAWKLEVLYSPQISLTIQNSSRSSIVVNEDSQVIIDCHISANPPLVDLQFTLNSAPIQRYQHFDVRHKNVSQLVIGQVNGKHRGRYQCLASNREGVSRSNEVQLDVLYVPYCRDAESDHNRNELNDNRSNKPISNDQSSNVHSQSKLYALSINESAKLVCNVDANPAPNHFYWTINSDYFDDNHIFAQSDRENELTFTASSYDTYGKVLCWAKNELGIQKNPCVFVISKAGPPAMLVGCSVTNKTTTSLTVECFAGDNGGSVQHFNAHVIPETKTYDPGLAGESGNDGSDSRQQTEMTLTSQVGPTFYLTNLSPGTSYVIELFANNSRGQSEVTRLSVTTLFTKNTKLSNLISSSLQEIEYDPVFGVLLGALFTVLLIVIVAYISCRFRQRQINRRNKEKEEQIKQNFAFQALSQNQQYSNPDAKMDLQLNTFPNESGKSPNVISFEEPSNSNSKLNLYVIKDIKEEPVQLGNVLGKQSSSIQLANSLTLIGTNETTLIPFTATASSGDPSASAHLSALFQQPYLSTSGECLPGSSSSSCSTAAAMATQFISSNGTLLPAHTCFQQSGIASSSQPPHFFHHHNSNTNADTILYAPSSALQPQILSINDKINGIVLNNSHYGFYHSDSVPSSISETIVLHHHHHPHQQHLVSNSIPQSPSLHLTSQSSSSLSQSLPPPPSQEGD